jgi:flagellar biosynthesis protein FlhF
VRFEETATAGADAVPLGRRVVAFVGPTGVGKTTTIAKLAAPLALAAQQGREHGRRVGLVILDTYRIAAVEQLKTYGEIMDVPVRVAQGTRGIGAALDALADRDLVFVDTAGRSQKDHEQIAALRRALDDTPCEPHLVVSATAKPTDLLECARVFGVLRPRSLLVTKLDETNTLGPLLALVRESGLGISFVTSGQRVPEDIEPADPARLAARLLGE